MTKLITVTIIVAISGLILLIVGILLLIKKEKYRKLEKCYGDSCKDKWARSKDFKKCD